MFGVVVGAGAAMSTVTLTIDTSAFVPTAACTTYTATFNNSVSLPVTYCARYGILSVSSTSLQVTTQPGSTSSATFTLSNQGFAPVTYSIPYDNRTTLFVKPSTSTVLWTGSMGGVLHQTLQPGASAVVSFRCLSRPVAVLRDAVVAAPHSPCS